MIYKNNTTGEMYHSGAITRRLANGVVVIGTPTPEMLAEWGFTPYTPPQPQVLAPSYCDSRIIPDKPPPFAPAKIHNFPALFCHTLPA